MTVSRDELLRRFLLHLLPKGFVRIRHFGFLANQAAPLSCLGASPSPRHCIEKRIADVDRSRRTPAVALSQLRRPHRRRRTTHLGTTPTPFSTTPGHCCMNSLAHIPHSLCFRVSRRSVFPFHPGILFLSLPRSTSAVNANQKWEVEEAIQRTNELAEVDPWWMEEPTSPDDILGHARIRRVMQGAIDVCQIDSCRLARGQ
jgi:hypothetical protein